MKHKKATGDHNWYLIGLIIALLVLAVVTFGFVKNWNPDETKKFTTTGDYDNDGIPDAVDSEPCQEGKTDRSCLQSGNS